MKRICFLITLIAVFNAYPLHAVDFPNELFGVKIGMNVDELKGVEGTNSHQTISFVPSKADRRIDVYWASHDRGNKITGVHGYKIGMQPQECLGLRDSIIKETSEKDDIIFVLKKRSSGSEYYFSESEGLAIVIECRNKGTRLRFALAMKRKG